MCMQGCTNVHAGWYQFACRVILICIQACSNVHADVYQCACRHVLMCMQGCSNASNEPLRRPLTLSGEDACQICWEALSSSPAIMLNCRHTCHLTCAQDHLKQVWAHTSHLQLHVCKTCSCNSCHVTSLAAAQRLNTRCKHHTCHYSSPCSSIVCTGHTAVTLVTHDSDVVTSGACAETKLLCCL